MEYDIYCPHHSSFEKLQVPGDPAELEGQVNCTPNQGQTPSPLKIRIYRGFLVDADVP